METLYHTFYENNPNKLNAGILVICSKDSAKSEVPDSSRLIIYYIYRYDSYNFLKNHSRSQSKLFFFMYHQK